MKKYQILRLDYDGETITYREPIFREGFVTYHESFEAAESEIAHLFSTWEEKGVEPYGKNFQLIIIPYYQYKK